MNKIIEEQLKNCKIARLTNFDAEHTTFYIPKYKEPIYELNKCYLVQLPPDWIDNNKSNLATNWNHCTSPTSVHLKIFVSRVLGSMIFVDTLAYDYKNQQDLSEMWSGWLDTKYIKQICCL